MKTVVQFSTGKDSQASLIWACKTYGVNNVVAVFCNTGWEHKKTYEHFYYVVDLLGVDYVVLSSIKYDGMLDLAFKKKRFPSTKARFCTEELKSKPFIDWVLKQQSHLRIIQGIRKDESLARSKMNQVCRQFKFYFQPYGYDKNGKPKYHTYRKNEILKWCEQWADDILRPVFDWTGQQVIDYIIENGQKPNPLYYMGMKRVGCYPCVMANQSEVKQIYEWSPEYIEKINKAEIELGSTFFPPNYIPKRFCSNTDANGKKYPSIGDVVAYVNREQTLQMFEVDRSCMSFYAICE